VSEYVQSYLYRHLYKSDNAITIPVTVTSGRSAGIDMLGKLDTGSTFRIFERAYAKPVRTTLVQSTYPEQKIRLAIERT